MKSNDNQDRNQQSLLFLIAKTLSNAKQDREKLIKNLLKNRDRAELESVINTLVDVMIGYTSACDEAVYLHLLNNEIHPHTIDGLNLPSLKGAINGYSLANGIDRSKLCDTCAFKRGTLGNCSESTQADLEYAVNIGEVFYCHDDSCGKTKPVNKACQGWVQFNNKVKNSSLMSKEA